MDTENSAAKRARPRSPGYPGITLEQAVSRAQAIYNNEKGGAHFVPLEVIFEHWGYAPKSGGARVAFAALNYFGLLESKGSGPNKSAKLSDRALDILVSEAPDSPRRIKALKDAALAPAIHEEIWKAHPKGLPSEGALRVNLVRERSFTETGAQEFIRQFLDTIKYANLAAGDESAKQGNGKADANGLANRSSKGDGGGRQHPPVGMKEVEIPVPGIQWPTLKIPFPMDEGDWDKMQLMLDAMKPALVKPKSSGEKGKDDANKEGAGDAETS